MRGGDKREKILKLAESKGVITAAEINSLGIHHEYIRQLIAEKKLVKINRGLYTLPDAEATQHHNLVQAARAVPKGIICLLSALRFYEIGTQLPHEVWMAIDRRAGQPRVKRPKIRIVRFSGEALTKGIERHVIEGVDVKIYCPAKTVADCFKYRNKIGLDVALEALRETWRNKKATMDELWKAAKVCRVTNIMRPYLEAIIYIEQY